MAILWQKTVDQNRYEIRTAGKTRRLYTNGVCHSEFNADKIFTGSVWDLLILPAWFYGDDEIRRILVLGVGGGAVLLQLDHLLETDAIIGIESDPVHLHLARKFFGSTVPGITLIEAEAGAWLDAYRGEPFDMARAGAGGGGGYRMVGTVAAPPQAGRAVDHQLCLT